MSKRAQSTYRHNYAVVPGETLWETIEARDISTATLAEGIGVPEQIITEIIAGKAPITAETALQLERFLGVPASFWNNLERNYRVVRAGMSA